MSDLDAFDMGGFEDLDQPSYDDDVDLGPVGGPPQRNTRFLLLATVLVILILLGAVAVLLVAIQQGKINSDYQNTVVAVYMTNTQVELFKEQTALAKLWTATPSPTLTASFTATWTNTPTTTPSATATATASPTATASVDVGATLTAQYYQALTYSPANLTGTALARQATYSAQTLTALAQVSPTLTPIQATVVSNSQDCIGCLALTINAIAATNQSLSSHSTTVAKTATKSKAYNLDATVKAVEAVLQNGSIGGLNSAIGAKPGLRRFQDTGTGTPTPTQTPSPTGTADGVITATQLATPTVEVVAVTLIALSPTPLGGAISPTATVIEQPTTNPLSTVDVNATINSNDATIGAIAATIRALAEQTVAPSGSGGPTSTSVSVHLDGPIIVVNVTQTPQPTLTRTATRKGGLPNTGLFDGVILSDKGVSANTDGLAVIGFAAVGLVGVIVAARRLRVRE